MTDAEKLKKFEAKEAARKEQVKKYFARRNVRFDVYKKFFETKANAQEKQNLVDMLAKI